MHAHNICKKEKLLSATQRAPKLTLITSRLSPGQGKKGIKLFHAESVLHILHDTE